MTAQEIKSLRLRLGMTQHQLADAIGVDQVSVCKWENGAKPSRLAMKQLERLVYKSEKEGKMAAITYFGFSIWKCPGDCKCKSPGAGYHINRIRDLGIPGYLSDKYPTQKLCKLEAKQTYLEEH